MKITYSRYAQDYAVAEHLIKRFTKALALESMHRPNGELNFNDIATAMGGLMLQLLEEVPPEQRTDLVTRYVDVLRMETKSAAASEQPAAVARTVQ